MAKKLKYELNQEAFDALDDGIKGLYEKDGEAFRLSVDGVASKTRVDEFRESNLNLERERDRLTQLLAKHVPQEELDRLANELATQRTQDIATKLSKVMINQQISTLALSRGARPEAIDDITQRASKHFKITESGTLVPHADPGPDGALTPEQFIDALRNSHGYYFEGSNGGGAAGSRRDSSGRFSSEAKIKFKEDLKTPLEKSNFIREHGFKAFEDLPLKKKPASSYDRWKQKKNEV